LTTTKKNGTLKDKTMTDYIITSKKKKKVLITKDLMEAQAFIVKLKDAKIRTVNYEAKLSLVAKKDFLNLFLESTQDKNKFCDLAEALIKGKTNVYDYLNTKGLWNYFKEYQKTKKETL